MIACLAILADKDAEAMIEALAPALDAAVCTELPPPDGPKWTIGRCEARRRAFGAEELVRICAVPGWRPRPSPTSRALWRAGASSRLAETGGVLLVTGSHYVLAPGPRRARSVRGLSDEWARKALDPNCSR